MIVVFIDIIILTIIIITHDDVIKWKQFPRYWPFVRGIHRSPVNSPHKGQWRGALMFSLICTRINGWVNNDGAGDLRRHRAHYDVTVMTISVRLLSLLLLYTNIVFVVAVVAAYLVIIVYFYPPPPHYHHHPPPPPPPFVAFLFSTFHRYSYCHVGFGGGSDRFHRYSENVVCHNPTFQPSNPTSSIPHGDVIKWKHFPR